VPPLSVTIVTRNEAAHIEAALQSVSWADERIVIDAESSDDTVAIARRSATSVLVRPWPGYGAQKNFAASLARNDWILSIDADERVTPDLGAEIRRTLGSNPGVHGFQVPRITYHLGRWIRSTDWYPDYQLRLYDRRHGRWNDRRVHESVTLDGSAGRLRGELQHLAYRDLSHHLETIDRYTTLAARQMFEEGRRASALDLLVHPPAAFLRNYVLRAGFRQGSTGLIISLVNSYYVMLKFAKLRELQDGGAHAMELERHETAPLDDIAGAGPSDRQR
jgi:glycosyltransferase involved in cell wall biosynthesis